MYNLKRKSIDLVLIYVGIVQNYFNNINENNFMLTNEYQNAWLVSAKKAKLIQQKNNNFYLKRKAKKYVNGCYALDKYIVYALQSAYYLLVINKAMDGFENNISFGYGLTNDCKYIKPFFSKISELYNYKIIQALYKNKNFKILNINNETKILDYGCGYGNFICQLKKFFDVKNIFGFENGFEVNANDFALIKKEDELHKDYDIIFLNKYLHHQENWKAELEKCFNLLNENGTIIVTEVDYPSNANFEMSFFGIIEKIQGNKNIPSDVFYDYFKQQNLEFKVGRYDGFNLYFIKQKRIH